MNQKEIHITIGICILFICRMIGIFMVVPAINTTDIFLEQGNKILIGCAVGIYGLMQVVFQIPFGLLSEKIGYKKTILIGLFIFFMGSIVLSFSKSIYILIFGRALQGVSAISSVSLAFLSGSIREQNYTKSIACVGASFGFSFLISILCGPVIVTLFGIDGLFKIISILSLVSILVAVYYVFPYNFFPIYDCFKTRKSVFNVLWSYDIFGYIMSVFFLHFLLTLNFMIIPKKMELLGYFLCDHWKIYLVVIFISVVCSIPIILYSERKCYVKVLMNLLISILVLVDFLFYFFENEKLIFFLGVQLFFISFILCESFLPSLLMRVIPFQYKSIIMSIYSTSQFFGIALGGILGGFLYNFFNLYSICLLGLLFSIIWLIIFLFISPPVYIISFSIKMNNNFVYNLEIKRKIELCPGIVFFQYNSECNILYFKIDRQRTDKNIVRNILKNFF